MERIAIVGTGIAGLGCAHYLRNKAEITLLEKNASPGGHTNTQIVNEDGREVPIDTGFIVFNKVTYPLLTKLFEDLSVPVKPAEMSFAVRHDGDDIEFNGMGLNKFFAQRGNIIRPAFYRMLLDVLRFFRVARAAVNDEKLADCTLLEFCERNQLGREFREWYLIPMSSSVWSTEPSRVLEFPALLLIRFFHNHGFLGVSTHHPWFTVDGGARTYVEKIIQGSGSLRLQAEINSIHETMDGVKLRTASGEVLRFDRVILAAHADQALRALEKPDALQQELLSPFSYQRNHAVLHTDRSFMPIRKRAWAAWNFLVEPSRVKSSPQTSSSTVHYWMNALQGVSEKRNYFVSLNCDGRIRDEHILYETEYEHPVFTVATMKAQQRLAELNQRSPRQRIFFCGSYFRHGFHEDALWSAHKLCETLAPVLGPAS